MIDKLVALKQHAGFMKYFKNTVWLSAEKILRMVVGLFVGVWVARYLGPDQYGLLSYAHSFVGLFAVIATLGLDGIVVRELVQDETRATTLLGTAFWLKVLGAFLVLIVLAAAIQFTSNNRFENILVFIIASSVVFQSFNVIDFYFQSRVQSRYSVYARVIALTASSFLKIGLILIDAPLIAFAWVAIFDNAMLMLGMVYFYIRQKDELAGRYALGWHFDWQIAKELLKDGWPMIFSGMAIAFYMKLDQTMVKELLDEKAVGYYAAAVRLSEVWLFITVAITKSFYPSIVNAKKRSESLYLARLQKLYQVLILIALLISIVTTMVSHQLIHYTFGDQYMAAAGILAIYIWSNIFVFLNNGSWNWYMTENLQHIAAIRLMMGAVANFFLNLVFIKKYGLEGAAYATILSYALASYFGNLISKKTWINFRMQTLAMINVFNVRSFYK